MSSEILMQHGTVVDGADAAPYRVDVAVATATLNHKGGLL